MKAGIIARSTSVQRLKLAGASLGLEFDWLGDSSHWAESEKNLRKWEELIGGLDFIIAEDLSLPLSTAEWITARVPLFPNVEALRVSKDRLRERIFSRGLGIPVEDFLLIDSYEELLAALSRLGVCFPSLLKKRYPGDHDSSDHCLIRNSAEAKLAWENLQGEPLMIERDPRGMRCSLTVARSKNGEIASYPLMEKRGHQLFNVPHRYLTEHLNEGALKTSAEKVLEALDHVGAMTINFFEEGALDQIIPGLHPIADWTLRLAKTDQYENHLRGILGLPLGPTYRLA